MNPTTGKNLERFPYREFFCLIIDKTTLLLKPIYNLSVEFTYGIKPLLTLVREKSMKMKSILIASLCCMIALNSPVMAEDFFEGLEGEEQEESTGFDQAEEIPLLDFEGDDIKDAKATCFPAGRFTKS